MNRDDRDMLIRALAAYADPDNAIGVLTRALEGLQHDLRVAASACGRPDELNKPDLRVMLLGLSERSGALCDFVGEPSDVNFRPPTEGGAS